MCIIICHTLHGLLNIKIYQMYVDVDSNICGSFLHFIAQFSTSFCQTSHHISEKCGKKLIFYQYFPDEHWSIIFILFHRYASLHNVQSISSFSLWISERIDNNNENSTFKRQTKKQAKFLCSSLVLFIEILYACMTSIQILWRDGTLNRLCFK